MRPKAPKILKVLLHNSKELTSPRPTKLLKDSKRFQKIPKDSKRLQKIPKESKRIQKILWKAIIVAKHSTALAGWPKELMSPPDPPNSKN